ncbi:MAG: translation initiation factor IF-6 [Candidatus Thermoplasmatota archaeon]|nr:translation initiation factor IF-6 [Candidatus Thermoplasmatota archaeon]
MLVPAAVSAGEVRLIERLLEVPVVQTQIADVELTGSLSTLNSHGVIVADPVEDEELAKLREHSPVTVLRTKLNALGNNILVNDHGAVVHPGFSHREVEAIEAALGVKVVSGTVAGEGTVSKTAVATNKGALVHPAATPEEMEIIHQALKVPVQKTTANFGIPLVGACVVANSKGIIVGERTTPVELVHIEDGLSVYD